MLHFLLIIFLVLLFLTFIHAGVAGAPWVPTRSFDVQRIAALAQIQPNQIFYDIGCGDGKILSAIAKAGGRAKGLEIALLPYLLAKIRGLFLPRGLRYQVKYQNFWHADLSDADAVYFFLMPKILNRVKDKLTRELRPGAKIISYVWPIPGLTPIKIDDQPGKPKIYLYQI